MNMHLQGGVASGVQRPNAGVDVSKQHLDVCLHSSSGRLGNDAQGWSELVAMLKAAEVDLVVIEATGGYERGAVCALQAAGVAVARVNPRQARDFAKSMGILAKTDQVDARTLRDFADVLARHDKRGQYITPIEEPARRELGELMDRRRQLVEMRVAEHNRSEHAGPRARRSIDSVIKLLDKQLGLIEDQKMTVVRGDDHQRLLPTAVAFDPVGDGADRSITTEHRSDRVVEVVVVIGPVDIPRFDHHPEPLRIA